MKLELEPNMYVRTKEGYICKILKLNEPFEDDGYLDHNDIGSPRIQEKNVIKASHNITDLVQENDFVNGEKVSSIQYEGVGFEHIKCVQTICKFDSLDNQFYTETYFDKDIKSIVTKEQFEAIQYKVVE